MTSTFSQYVQRLFSALKRFLLAVGRRLFFRKRRRIRELETQLAHAQELLERVGGGDALELRETVHQLEGQRARAENDYVSLLAKTGELEQKRDELTRQIGELKGSYKEAVTLVDKGLIPFAHPAESSVQLKDDLAKTRDKIKRAVRWGTATQAATDFAYNGSASRGQKFVADMEKMMLRAYNAEAENCILTVKAGNGEAAKKRLERTRNQVASLGKLISLEITSSYHKLRIRELELALEYQNALKREKEEEREKRAQLREEKQAQRELEVQRAKLVKEAEHYQRVLEELRAQGKDDEAAAMEAKLADVNKEIESVDFRAANVRAGYVYVISNLGSFGDNMVKIGMTRRLDPMDRIRELSDASVPFNFDVHALFFTDDAVGVEAELHRRFADHRVNLVNQRREFFAVSPLDVRTALLEVAGNLLEFVEEPDAEQYRLSEAMRQAV